MALMAEAGFRHLVSFHKRGRIVSDPLLEPFADVNAYHELKDNLRYLEMPATSVDDVEKAEGVRYILCCNPEKACQDAAVRESAMEEAHRRSHCTGTEALEGRARHVFRQGIRQRDQGEGQSKGHPHKPAHSDAEQDLVGDESTAHQLQDHESFAPDCGSPTANLPQKWEERVTSREARDRPRDGRE
ncbi:hypothetical protein SAMN05421799_101337 [Alicyclobacillus vulcanalis]|uniref:Uncharacterized protein n=1 Tax=Alicyclobacillus vulcanalis TaxID=252246 RepID=A0A1N7K3P0_9BACL|nr:hypothetical protein [Alicyclobacillus vulcanalis]SIS56215.1 hypothetical protein SAMN05421799_101337 [Alicyclobacillus vulcanalis]